MSAYHLHYTGTTDATVQFHSVARASYAVRPLYLTRVSGGMYASMHVYNCTYIMERASRAGDAHLRASFVSICVHLSTCVVFFSFPSRSISMDEANRHPYVRNSEVCVHDTYIYIWETMFLQCGSYVCSYICS